MSFGFLGGGNMARAIIQGLVSKGWSGNSIWVCDKSEQKRQLLEQDLEVNTTDSAKTLLDKTDTLVLAVKPQALEAAISPLHAYWRPEHLIISVLAGTSLDRLSGVCGDHRIVRAMPNTPAAIGQGMTVLVGNALVKNDDHKITTAIFEAVGEVAWLASESDMDAVTALSGSGPAYYFLFVEYMIKAATALGLDETLATALAKQTAIGACAMVANSAQTPRQLRTQVTSKGGTTAAALKVLMDRQLEDIVLEALTAASDRSKALKS
jgi:pyrroline-5-carboxylate reductase